MCTFISLTQLFIVNNNNNSRHENESRGYKYIIFLVIDDLYNCLITISCVFGCVCVRVCFCGTKKNVLKQNDFNFGFSHRIPRYQRTRKTMFDQRFGDLIR